MTSVHILLKTSRLPAMQEVIDRAGDPALHWMDQIKPLAEKDGQNSVVCARSLISWELAGKIADDWLNACHSIPIGEHVQLSQADWEALPQHVATLKISATHSGQVMRMSKAGQTVQEQFAASVTSPQENWEMADSMLSVAKLLVAMLGDDALAVMVEDARKLMDAHKAVELKHEEMSFPDLSYFWVNTIPVSDGQTLQATTTMGLNSLGGYEVEIHQDSGLDLPEWFAVSEKAVFMTAVGDALTDGKVIEPFEGISLTATARAEGESLSQRPAFMLKKAA
ncbi:MAG: hypothetical protein Alpg2KO_13640 [Alphaproteobacteria bacterium]